MNRIWIEGLEAYLKIFIELYQFWTADVGLFRSLLISFDASKQQETPIIESQWAFKIPNVWIYISTSKIRSSTQVIFLPCQAEWKLTHIWHNGIVMVSDTLLRKAVLLSVHWFAFATWKLVERSRLKMIIIWIHNTSLCGGE